MKRREYERKPLQIQDLSTIPMLMGAEGTETIELAPEKQCLCVQRAAKGGAGASELAELISCWPHLSAPIRAVLLQVARSAQSTSISKITT